MDISPISKSKSKKIKKTKKNKKTKKIKAHKAQRTYKLKLKKPIKKTAKKTAKKTNKNKINRPMYSSPIGPQVKLSRSYLSSLGSSSLSSQLTNLTAMFEHNLKI